MDDGRRFTSGHLKKSKAKANESITNSSNQPFDSEKISTDVGQNKKNCNRAVLSLTESALLVDMLKGEGYDVIKAAGAGYKILAVIQGNYSCNKYLKLKLY